MPMQKQMQRGRLAAAIEKRQPRPRFGVAALEVDCVEGLQGPQGSAQGTPPGGSPQGIPQRIPRIFTEVPPEDLPEDPPEDPPVAWVWGHPTGFSAVATERIKQTSAICTTATRTAAIGTTALPYNLSDG
jgi:hypothetical protein